MPQLYYQKLLKFGIKLPCYIFGIFMGYPEDGGLSITVCCILADNGPSSLKDLITNSSEMLIYVSSVAIDHE